MLCLSQTTGYAILALGCLASHANKAMLARDISQDTGVPLPYLSKILHTLARRGYLSSKRGYRGGYCLNPKSPTIDLLSVAQAIDPHGRERRCLLGIADCNEEKPCPAHRYWSKHRDRLDAALSKLTIRDISRFQRKMTKDQSSTSTHGSAKSNGSASDPANASSLAAPSHA